MFQDTMTITAPAQVQSQEARFREFLREHQAQAISMAWRLLGEDRAAAEDLAQEAFVRAWKALPRFRGEASLSTWFYRILIRQVQNRRRWSAVRRRGRAFIARPEPSRPPLPDPGLQARILEAIDQLSRGQREAFVLIYMEGLNVAQSAEILGKAEGTLKSHLSRALKSLRKSLADLKELS